jgi:hypothetical protein
VQINFSKFSFNHAISYLHGLKISHSNVNLVHSCALFLTGSFQEPLIVYTSLMHQWSLPVPTLVSLRCHKSCYRSNQMMSYYTTINLSSDMPFKFRRFLTLSQFFVAGNHFYFEADVLGFRFSLKSKYFQSIFWNACFLCKVELPAYGK